MPKDKKTSGKPTITRREASRLVAEAGAGAYQQGGATGGDPKSIKALLDAERVDLVGTIKARPLMLETFLVLEDMWRSKAHQDAPGLLRQAMTLYTYVNPAEARSQLAKVPQKFAEAVCAWSGSISATDFKELGELVLQHLTAFYDGAEPAQSSKKKLPRKRSKTGRVA